MNLSDIAVRRFSPNLAFVAERAVEYATFSVHLGPREGERLRPRDALLAALSPRSLDRFARERESDMV